MDDTQTRNVGIMNPKIASDSGYGSNKSGSNSQSQRSSGSSKSQHSSLSSESGSGYPSHSNVTVSETDNQCTSQFSNAACTGQSTSQAKRQSKKKKNNQDKPCLEKVEGRTSQDEGRKGTSSLPPTSSASGTPQAMDINHSLPSTNMSSSTSNTVPISTQTQSPAMQSHGFKGATHDTKALQMAALTHALSCVKKYQEPIINGDINDAQNPAQTNVEKFKEYLAEELKNETHVLEEDKDGFATVVSMEDGIVVYITSSISEILGFPRDMLVGRNFIDFMHPKDRMPFASHITCGVNYPNLEHNHVHSTGIEVKAEPFYCRIRQYKGLKSVGFGVADSNVKYHPFKLSMTLKNLDSARNLGKLPRKNEGHLNGMKPGNVNCVSQSSVYLVIIAKKIKSAYQYPDQIPSSPCKFVTRHSASCHLGHIDSDAISFLGHLPQDMIGYSILDFYHPEDMLIMKDIHEGIIQEQGRPFKSKPYRIRVYNGTFAVLETDWSCFINPWSWKVEFVIGQHRVVQGPKNPDVFMSPESEFLIPEEISLEARQIQEEIKIILSETVTRRISDPMRQQSSKRRKDLAALMETLLEEMAKTENSDPDKSGSQCSGMLSVLERDSVMLGEISPHRDDNCGSNQSSETPPSYNQLNYRDNLERFFQSQPKTMPSDESGDSSNKMDTHPSVNRSSDEDCRSLLNADDSSGSNTNNRSSDGFRQSRSSQGSHSGGGETYESDFLVLTEEALNRHNEDMQKSLIQKHREHKSRQNSASASQKTDIRSKRQEKGDGCHGIKRTVMSEVDEDCQGAVKQPHLDTAGFSSNNGPSSSVNLWPPFSISINPAVNSTTYRPVNSNLGCMLSVATIAVPSPYPPCYPNGGGNAPMPGPSNANSSLSFPKSMAFNSREHLTPSNTFRPITPSVDLDSSQPAPPHQPPVQVYPSGVVYPSFPTQCYGQPQPVLVPPYIGPIHPLLVTPNNSSVRRADASSGPCAQFQCSHKLPCEVKTCYHASSDHVTMAKNAGPEKQCQSIEGHRERFVPSGNHGISVNDSPSKNILNQPKSRKIVNPKGNMVSNLRNGQNIGIFGNHQIDLSKRLQKRSDPCQRYQKSPQIAFTNPPASSVMWRVPRSQVELRKNYIRRKGPPWLDEVKMTNHLVYKYQLRDGELSDVLQRDLKALKLFSKQPSAVDDQLGMLYKELETDEVSKKSLNLEGQTSTTSGSGSSGDDQPQSNEQHKKTRKKLTSYHYEKMIIVHEENAPFPPNTVAQGQQSTSLCHHPNGQLRS